LDFSYVFFSKKRKVSLKAFLVQVLNLRKFKKCRWADLHRRFPDYESGDIATNPQRQNCSVSSHRGRIFALLDTAVDAHQ
jgi:hypothetical protein